MKKNALFCFLPLLLATSSTAVFALEYPVGKPYLKHGMEIGAVYLQPVTMMPSMGVAAKDADVHLEADIHALDNNENGFPLGSWIPDLSIHYVLTKRGTQNKISGDFGAMVANDGPHYGANVKLLGFGAYHLEYTISPPSTSNGKPFMRHVDKETGVAEWFKPFKVSYDFIYAGVGKKGGY